LGIPSSQTVAAWVKAELNSVEWVSLFDICFQSVSRRWTGKSQEEILELIESSLPYIAEHLRDDSSNAILDGSAPRFQIDDEQSPYIKSLAVTTSEIYRKLQRIDPFKAEELCAEILKKFGASAYSTKKTGDGGVDFIGLNLNIVPEAFIVPVGCKAAIIGQTKRYKENNIINEKAIREFVGAALLQKHILQKDGKAGPLTPFIFAFWTTSEFEPNAKIYARNVGLWFMDGHTLATYVHNLGMREQVLTLPNF
jgi:restriction endonuclease Mrr